MQLVQLPFTKPTKLAFFIPVESPIAPILKV